MIILGRRGQMGQGVTTIAVLILVFVVMIVFFVLSGFWGKLEAFDGGVAEFGSIENFRGEDFLFENVEINGEDKWIISMVLDWKAGRFNKQEVGEALRPLVGDGGKDCLGIAYWYQLDGDKRLWENVDLELRSGELEVIFDKYPRFLAMDNIKLEGFSYVLGGERVYVNYYYDSCFGGASE